MTDLDVTGMSIAERSAYTAGELMAPLLNPDWCEHDYTFSGESEVYRSHVATADLMRLAELGKAMLHAIDVASEQNNEEFFKVTYGFYGPLIDAAIEEMDLPYHCGVCGVLSPDHTEECGLNR